MKYVKLNGKLTNIRESWGDAELQDPEEIYGLIDDLKDYIDTYKKDYDKLIEVDFDGSEITIKFKGFLNLHSELAVAFNKSSAMLQLIRDYPVTIYTDKLRIGDTSKEAFENVEIHTEFFEIGDSNIRDYKGKTNNTVIFADDFKIQGLRATRISDLSLDVIVSKSLEIYANPFIEEIDLSNVNADNTLEYVIVSNCPKLQKIKRAKIDKAIKAKNIHIENPNIIDINKIFVN